MALIFQLWLLLVTKSADYEAMSSQTGHYMNPVAVAQVVERAVH